METVPEKIFGYKILQESASQAKVPFEVGSFPVSLPGNLDMTANREKPELGWGAKFGPEGSSIIGSPSGNPE